MRRVSSTVEVAVPPALDQPPAFCWQKAQPVLVCQAPRSLLCRAGSLHFSPSVLICSLLKSTRAAWVWRSRASPGFHLLSSALLFVSSAHVLFRSENASAIPRETGMCVLPPPCPASAHACHLCCFPRAQTASLFWALSLWASLPWYSAAASYRERTSDLGTAGTKGLKGL